VVATGATCLIMALHATIEGISLPRSRLNWLVGLVLEITCVEAREIIMSLKFKLISCVQAFFWFVLFVTFSLGVYSSGPLCFAIFPGFDKDRMSRSDVGCDV